MPGGFFRGGRGGRCSSSHMLGYTHSSISLYHSQAGTRRQGLALYPPGNNKCSHGPAGGSPGSQRTDPPRIASQLAHSVHPICRPVHVTGWTCRDKM